MSRWVRRPVTAAAAAGVVAASFALASGASADHRARPTTLLSDALHAAPTTVARPAALVHHARPEDRYAMAGGCYAVRAANGHYVSRTGSGFAAVGADRAHAEPVHFQAIDLGKYLLFGTAKDFLAQAADPLPGGAHPATDTADGYVRGTGDETLQPARDPVLAASGTAADGSDTATKPARDAVRGNGVA